MGEDQLCLFNGVGFVLYEILKSRKARKNVPFFLTLLCQNAKPFPHPSDYFPVLNFVHMARLNKLHSVLNVCHMGSKNL